MEFVVITPLYNPEENLLINWVQLALHIHGFWILGFNQLWIKNIWKKIPEISKKQNLNLLHDSNIFGEGNGNPSQYSCLVNPMGRGVWWATVNEVTKESDTT